MKILILSVIVSSFIASFAFLSPAYSATFNPATVGELITAIQTANGNMEADDINLVPGMVYTITGMETGVPFSGVIGNNGLPIIIDDGMGNGITINGNGATIERDPALFSNNPNDPCSGPGIIFRIFQINSGAELTLNTLTIQNGCSDVFGGAIINDGTITEITHTTFTANMTTDENGGAISNENGGTIGEITYSTFSGNMANGSGGAIFNNISGAITTIAQSTFEMNEASAGGAIANPGTITEITHNTFSGNMAVTLGGAVYNNGGTITAMTNCTLSGNTATSLGGAIFSFGTMNISFTTIANNIATNVEPPIVMGPPFGGGIFQGTSGTLSIKNSIVGNNTGGDCFLEGGTFTSLGGNLDTDGTCGAGFMTVTSMALNLDPSGLQENGGPTQTIALCTGTNMPGAGCLMTPSVAIDDITLANCTDVADAAVTTDQRLFDRPETGGTMCDVGAYEVQPIGMLTIEKMTEPPDGTEFEFSGAPFPEGCGLDGIFFLSDNQSVTCILPEGVYTVAENVPAGFTLDISCTESPSFMTPSSVTLDIVAGDDVVCTFTNLGLSIDLSPLAATNNVLTDHTVTAVVLIENAPAEGVEVTFEVISGPNQGEMSDPNTGECEPNDCTTDANGQVSWTYSSEAMGTDTIVSSFFAEDFELTVESNTVSKTWIVIRNIPTLSEWGLIAMVGLLGIAALFYIRNRKAAA